jgi:hypothetical protein
LTRKLARQGTLATAEKFVDTPRQGDKQEMKKIDRSLTATMVDRGPAATTARLLHDSRFA